MKRFLAIILAGLMLLSLAACGGKKDENVVKRGVVGVDAGTGFSSKHFEHSKNEHGQSEQVYYSNLSTALMDLESEKIQTLMTVASTADYIVARHENVTAAKRDNIFNFAMMTLDSKQDVYDILNNAIKDMKADGALDSLIANELKAYIESDPEPKDLPHFDGAVTIKIGVTGDMPPMDFITSNGKAAGFNIALLAEIANRAKVNFELVQIEAGSRPMALSSGKVDVVFWIASVTCTKCNETTTEKTDGTLVTESYYSDSNAFVKLKSDK
jgi:polar amino acid transport system substrate-binding protein